MTFQGQDDSFPTRDPEVRAYLKRLLLAIFLGIVIVGSTAVWAWNKYGKRLEDAPPLPAGEPVPPHLLHKAPQE
jgi:hypothetical protein